MTDRSDTPRATSKARPGDQIAPILYRKKPVEIEAIRWSGHNLKEVIDFTGLHQSAEKWTWEEYEAVVAKDGLKIFTLEGPLMARVGDWIIKGVKGEFYPCKPDIFLATYQDAREHQSEIASASAIIDELHKMLDEAEISRKHSMDAGATWQEYTLADRLKIVLGANRMMERELDEKAEVEARCCPEDYGFEEWVGVLEKRDNVVAHRHLQGHDGQPPSGTWVVQRLDKKAAGRQLDGRTHDEYPA